MLFTSDWSCKMVVGVCLCVWGWMVMFGCGWAATQGAGGWVSRHGPLHKAVSQTGPCSSTVTPLNHMHAAQLWRLLSLSITSSSSPSFSDIHLKSFSLSHVIIHVRLRTKAAKVSTLTSCVIALAVKKLKSPPQPLCC